MVARRLTKAQWFDLIARFEDSNMTHAAFAHEHGLALSSFRVWLYRARENKHPKDSRFLEIVRQPSGSVVLDSSRVCIELQGGTRVIFDQCPPLSDLAALMIQLAGSRSC